MKNFKLSGWIVAGCIAMAQPMCALAAELSPEMKAIALAAEKEGTLKLSWAPNILGGARGAQAISQGMNKMFGTNVKLTYTPGVDLVQLGFQVGTEAGAGRPSSTDALLGVYNTVSALAKDKRLVSVPWVKMLPGRVGADIVEADGGAVRVASLPYGVAYNTKLMPNPPRTLAGFLKPEYKGKIASTPYAAGVDLLPAVMGKDKGMEYLTKLSAQLGGLIRCSEMNRVASGEFEALVLDCGPLDALLMKDKGLPIDEFMPQDFAMVSFFYGAVPTNSEHPNAAKLFFAYLLSEEGQKLQWDLWRLDLHSFPESQIRSRIETARKAGAKVTELSLQWVADHPEIEAAKPDVLKLLRSSK